MNAAPHHRSACDNSTMRGLVAVFACPVQNHKKAKRSAHSCPPWSTLRLAHVPSFFNDLNRPKPDIHLCVVSDRLTRNPKRKILKKFEEVLLEKKPDIVVCLLANVNSRRLLAPC